MSRVHHRDTHYCHIGPVCECSRSILKILSVFVGFSCWRYPETSWSPLLVQAYDMSVILCAVPSELPFRQLGFLDDLLNLLYGGRTAALRLVICLCSSFFG